MRRTPLRPSSPEKAAEWRRRTAKPLPKRSERQKARESTLEASRAALIEWTGGQCQFQETYEADVLGWITERCGWQGQHAHHVRRRSQGGSDTVANLRWLCPEHHRWVHDNVSEAVELGLLEHG